MAGCDLFTVKSVYRVSAYQVLLTGTVEDACAELRITATFPGDVRVGERADLEPSATAGEQNWSILLALPGGVSSSWCKTATVDVVAIAFARDGRQLCESGVKDKVLSCCAQVSNLGPHELACRTRPGTGGALDRAVQWKFTIDWPAETPDGTEISVTVELTSVDDPTYREYQNVTVAFPDTEGTTPAFHLPSGTRWTGDVYITLPSFCRHKRDIPEYVVPVCNAPECLLPPAGDIFLTVRDVGTAVVADPNDTGCVSGDFITVTAQAWPGTLTWRAEVNSMAVTTTPTANAREVRIEMPPGEDRVTVTAQVVVDAASGCIHSRSVTAKCCDCTPLAADYALEVKDEHGNVVEAGSCVDGAFVDVTAPEHEGGVEWDVDGQPRDTDPPNRRTLRVPLNDNNPHKVAATVGRDRCTKKVTRDVERCLPGVPVQSESFWPRIPWCVIIMFAGIVLLLVGLLLLTIGMAALASVVCWFWLASLLIETVVGPWIVFIVWMIVTIGGILIGSILIAIGVILLIIWLLACGGCDEQKSPIPFCESLKLLFKFLQSVGIILAILETIVLLASGIGAAICGVGAASFMAVIDFAMWLVDIGVLVVLIYGVEYFGNAVGCFNTTPSSWPFSVLQIKLPPPGSNNLPCFDADAQMK